MFEVIYAAAEARGYSVKQLEEARAKKSRETRCISQEIAFAGS